jgi:transcriptional regulator with XRE-family HTH domain
MLSSDSGVKCYRWHCAPNAGRIQAMRIGERVRLARTRAGLGVNQLERACHLGKGVISNIENGRRPNPDAETLRLIAEATSHQFTWLAFGEGPEKRGDTEPPPSRWPGLEQAIEMLSAELSPRVVEVGRRMGAACPVDLDVTEWILVLRNLQKKISAQ